MESPLVLLKYGPVVAAWPGEDAAQAIMATSANCRARVIRHPVARVMAAPSPVVPFVPGAPLRRSGRHHSMNYSPIHFACSRVRGGACAPPALHAGRANKERRLIAAFPESAQSCRK